MKECFSSDRLAEADLGRGLIQRAWTMLDSVTQLLRTSRKRHRSDRVRHAPFGCWFPVAFVIDQSFLIYRVWGCVDSDPVILESTHLASEGPLHHKKKDRRRLPSVSFFRAHAIHANSVQWRPARWKGERRAMLDRILNSVDTAVPQVLPRSHDMGA